MQIAQRILDGLQIASPCSADWAAMRGDARIRHCAQCGRHVYDLSSLSADEGLALIRDQEGRLCVRLWRRADGTVLTADCPVGRRLRSRRMQRASAAAMGVLAAAMLNLACAKPKVEARVTPAASTLQPAAQFPPTAFGMENGIPTATVVMVGSQVRTVELGGMVVDFNTAEAAGDPLPGPTQGRSYGRFQMEHLPLP
ncbi:MAG TPA: hypothetical protein VJ483_07455 [Holophagaceae bacterium]|nr:hypothetical protein [Holophagaceae bacterium]